MGLTLPNHIKHSTDVVPAFFMSFVKIKIWNHCESWVGKPVFSKPVIAGSWNLFLYYLIPVLIPKDRSLENRCYFKNICLRNGIRKSKNKDSGGCIFQIDFTATLAKKKPADTRSVRQYVQYTVFIYLIVIHHQRDAEVNRFKIIICRR